MKLKTDYLATGWKSFDNFDNLMESAKFTALRLMVTQKIGANDHVHACASYGTFFMCKHMLTLCYRIKALEWPENIPEYLKANPKRGPKSKAKRALTSQ